MKYGIYTVTTRGNGLTALIVRKTDNAEVFLQGEDSAEFLDELEACDRVEGGITAGYIAEYFLGIDEAGGWDAYNFR